MGAAVGIGMSGMHLLPSAPMQGVQFKMDSRCWSPGGSVENMR